MSQSTVYLVNGSNRGIGLGLVTQILETHDSAYVYAGVHNPDNASALKDLEAKYPTRVAAVKIVSADAEGNTSFGREIEKRHGCVDTVIANAGICNAVNYVAEFSPANLEERFHKIGCVAVDIRHPGGVHHRPVTQQIHHKLPEKLTLLSQQSQDMSATHYPQANFVTDTQHTLEIILPFTPLHAGRKFLACGYALEYIP